MRRIVIAITMLALAAAAAGTPPRAAAESIDQRLGHAKSDKAAADAALHKVQAQLEDLLAQYAQAQSDLALATRDALTVQQAQFTLTQELATAQAELDRRAADAYELGPSVSLALFLGSQSPSDFASAQVYAAHALNVGSEQIATVQTLRASLTQLSNELAAREAAVQQTVARLQALAAGVSAQLDQAQTLADAAGVKVANLEQQKAELEAQQAALAASLADYLRNLNGGCGSGPVHDLIVADFPADQMSMALFVATRESNCRPNAYNPTEVPPYGHAEGVFQILYPGIWNAWAPKCGHGGEDPYDATANVAVAACMQAADGWAPWGL